MGAHFPHISAINRDFTKCKSNILSYGYSFIEATLAAKYNDRMRSDPDYIYLKIRNYYCRVLD